jgi:hypothetical protein
MPRLEPVWCKKIVRLSVSRALARLHCNTGFLDLFRSKPRPQPTEPTGSRAQFSTLKRINLRVSAMNTFLLASQIVAYGVSIVSASVNIAKFVQHRRSKSERRFQIARLRVTG